MFARQHLEHGHELGPDGLSPNAVFPPRVSISSMIMVRSIIKEQTFQRPRGQQSALSSPQSDVG